MIPPDPAAPEESNDWVVELRRYGGPVVVALFGVRLLVALVWLGGTLPYRWDLSFPEAAVVARALDVAGGESAYEDWREWPHHFAPYGPLTYYPVGWLSSGDDRDRAMERVYRLGRLQSLVSLAGLLGVCFLLLRRLEIHGARSLLGLAIIFSWETLFAYVASFRPDAPQVFLSLLAIWIVVGGAARGWRPFGVFACLTLAFWFKATAWGPLALAAWWIWRDRGWRGAGVFVFAFALANVLAALLLDRLMSGRLFLNLVGSLNNGIDPSNWIKLAGRFPLSAWFVLTVGALAAIANLFSRRRDDPRFVLSLAALLSLSAALLSYLKVGADINYLLEAFPLLGIVTLDAILPFWMGRRPASPELATESPHRPLGKFAVPLLVSLAVYVNFTPLVRAREDIESVMGGWKPLPVTQRVQSIEGPVLSVIPYLGLAAAGEATVLDHYQYRVLAERGKLDTSELIRRVRGGEFAAVLIEGNLDSIAEEYYTPEFGSALREAYRPAEARVDRFGSLSLLRPKLQDR